MVSVKTETPVAKDAMLSVMQTLRQITVQAPVHMGDVILENVCGAKIVATKDVL
jgi:CxxC motif-containing protein